MGTCEAIARTDFGIPDFNRLFFNCSFVFAKEDSPLGFATGPVLNKPFSRALPLVKAEFLHRLEYCYGITLLHKGYCDFEKLLADVDDITALGLLIISEIDFCHLPKHAYYKNTHDGHMMVVGGRGQTTDTLSIVEAAFGTSELPLEDYRACFEDVRRRGRQFYLLVVRRPDRVDRCLPLDSVLNDLSTSLDNLLSDDPQNGLKALDIFAADLEEFLRGNNAAFIIPGFWTFMCNARNNLRFLSALDPALKLLAAGELTQLEQQMSWLYKRWFMLNITMESAVSKSCTDNLAQIPALLSEVAAREAQTPSLIAGLYRVLRGARMK
jgi:hypothetical protein